ncbi:hypothetical protein [Magnetococcus sp. PR-3]|uniref:hypothetical protein n=1 Tax=Magnetococcus sp. PR-3 TaxID=3120355 RepID=UPI002FCDEB1D
MFPKQCIRLRVPPERAASLHRHPVLAMAQGKRRIRSRIVRFYDTPQWDLRQASLALQVQNRGKGWQQRLVSLTDGGRLGVEKGGRSVLTRHKIQADRLELLTMLRDPKVRHTFDRLDAGTLSHRFTLRSQRRTLRLAREGGAPITLIEEVGEILDGNGKTPFHDLLVMADETNSALGYEVALSLHAQLQGGLLFAAPAERVMADEQPLPFSYAWAWPALPMRKETDITKAYQQLSSTLLEQLFALIPQLLHGGSEGACQAQRTLAQRLEALEAMDDWLVHLAHPEAAQVWGALRQELQDDQQWGVFLDDLLTPYADNLEEPFTTAPWTHRAQSQWQQGQRSWQLALHGTEFAQAVLGMGLWLARRGWLSRRDEDDQRETPPGLAQWVRERLEENNWPMVKGVKAGEPQGLQRMWRQWLLLTLFGRQFEQMSNASKGVVELDLSLLEYGIYQEALDRAMASVRFIYEVAPLAKRFKDVAVEADGATQADFEAWFDTLMRQQQGQMAQAMAELELSAGFWVNGWGGRS